MNIFELDEAVPNVQFLFHEACEWIGKEVYLKHIRMTGIVEEMKLAEKGYDLLIHCGDVTLTLSKQEFATYADVRPDQIHLPTVYEETV